MLSLLALPFLVLVLSSHAGGAFSFVAKYRSIRPTRDRISPEARLSSQIEMSSDPKVDFGKTETVGSTRWMRLETLTYKVEDGSERKW